MHILHQSSRLWYHVDLLKYLDHIEGSTHRMWQILNTDRRLDGSHGAGTTHPSGMLSLDVKGESTAN